MNAFMMENWMNDRIREIEADVRKNSCLKKTGCVSVQSDEITSIINWIRKLMSITPARSAHQK